MGKNLGGWLKPATIIPIGEPASNLPMSEFWIKLCVNASKLLPNLVV